MMEVHLPEVFLPWNRLEVASSLLTSILVRRIHDIAHEVEDKLETKKKFHDPAYWEKWLAEPGNVEIDTAALSSSIEDIKKLIEAE
ncbi:MAG: hypothetical protein Q7R90_00215, partial [bacterium]|nr:hypothetical protein [bacterium]